MSKHIAFRLDQIESRPLEWVWFPYLVRGKLTLLEGAIGVGKSSVVFDLVAKFSRGELTGGKVARTLLLSADHHPADTILPRLKDAGADLGCVAVMGGLGQPSIRLSDCEDLDEIASLIQTHKIDVVVIDPLTAFVGKGVNLRDETALREAMRPVLELAEKHRVAVLVVVPERRGRVVGDCGVFSVALELKATDAGVELAVRRSSLGPKPKPMVARLWGVGKVVWTVQPEAVGSLESAKLWLEGFLGGKTISMREVLAAGGVAGHSTRTLERAKSELGYRSKANTMDGRRESLWIGEPAA